MRAKRKGMPPESAETALESTIVMPPDTSPIREIVRKTHSELIGKLNEQLRLLFPDGKVPDHLGLEYDLDFKPVTTAKWDNHLVVTLKWRLFLLPTLAEARAMPLVIGDEIRTSDGFTVQVVDGGKKRVHGPVQLHTPGSTKHTGPLAK